MTTRLINWSDAGHLLTDAQFGFRQGRGTTDCIFLLQNLIEKVFNDKGSLFVAFIDYQKAFDYLDRSAMWAKLIKNGISNLDDHQVITIPFISLTLFSTYINSSTITTFSKIMQNLIH